VGGRREGVEKVGGVKGGEKGVKRGEGGKGRAGGGDGGEGKNIYRHEKPYLCFAV